jgi:hypothetical protein
MPRSEFLRAIHPEVSGRIRTMTTQDAEDWFAAVKGLETAAAVVAIREFFQAWDWSKFPHSIDFQVWHDAQLRARATAEGAKVHKIDGDWPAFPRCRKARVTFKAGAGYCMAGWNDGRLATNCTSGGARQRGWESVRNGIDLKSRGRCGET